ncbi:MAG: hypothetical protein J3K34DRAFT_449070 [Monoraphidium minutum]|nr:MAG: hypothetical protein J3K34DRAFT_449070 [Monoraphidium minutum]
MQQPRPRAPRARRCSCWTALQTPSLRAAAAAPRRRRRGCAACANRSALGPRMKLGARLCAGSRTASPLALSNGQTVRPLSFIACRAAAPPARRWRPAVAFVCTAITVPLGGPPRARVFGDVPAPATTPADQRAALHDCTAGSTLRAPTSEGIWNLALPVCFRTLPLLHSHVSTFCRAAPASQENRIETHVLASCCQKHRPCYSRSAARPHPRHSTATSRARRRRAHSGAAAKIGGRCELGTAVPAGRPALATNCRAWRRRAPPAAGPLYRFFSSPPA